MAVWLFVDKAQLVEIGPVLPHHLLRQRREFFEKLEAHHALLLGAYRQSPQRGRETRQKLRQLGRGLSVLALVWYSLASLLHAVASSVHQGRRSQHLPSGVMVRLPHPLRRGPRWEREGLGVGLSLRLALSTQQIPQALPLARSLAPPARRRVAG